MITRSPLKYYGGKFGMADWIIGYIPNHTCYVEPYGGAMGVLLNKAPSEVEVYNDLDSRVVTFFKVLRDNADELIRQIQLTPYAREEVNNGTDADTEIEVARRFYVACNQNRNWNNNSWRFSKNNSSFIESWNGTDHLVDISTRLKQVYIEHNDALRVIELYDGQNTVFYIDPPYMPETRSQPATYKHEMTEADHMRLAFRLREIRGMAIVSGYDCRDYDLLYPGWKKVKTTIQDQANNNVEEVLWISPRCVSAQRQGELFTF